MSVRAILQRVLFSCLLVAPDWASAQETDPSILMAASLRARVEARRNFRFGADTPGDNEAFALSQLRVSLRWLPIPWTTVFVEAQDARIFGHQAINANAVPNIFADDLDLHQGYLQLRCCSQRVAIEITAGRQKFNFGAKRLVASLEWVNTARVWDGLRLDLGKAQARRITAFSSRLVPVNPGALNDHAKTGSRMFNSYFHGAYYTDRLALPHTQVDVYWLLRHEGDEADNTHTAGARLHTRRGVWDFEVEGARQFGTFGGVTHQAAMFHGEVGYTTSSVTGSRFGIAYNYGSGDSDPDDSRHSTFDNLYPLNHAYYGYMDFFSLQNIHNAEVSFNTVIADKLRLRVAHQGFWLSEPARDVWYNAGGGIVRRSSGSGPGAYVGREIDLTAKYQWLDGRVLVEAGYGQFFTGDYVAGTGPSSNAHFFYLSTKLIG